MHVSPCRCRCIERRARCGIWHGFQLSRDKPGAGYQVPGEKDCRVIRGEMKIMKKISVIEIEEKEP